METVAKGIVRRRLEAPAILFLETHRPIAFIGSQALHFLTPIFGTFIDPERLASLARVLETPEGVDALITRIEAEADRI